MGIFGYNFHSGDVSVRVHDLPLSHSNLSSAVSCKVCVLGVVVNAYVGKRILARSVKSDGYVLTDAT